MAKKKKKLQKTSSMAVACKEPPPYMTKDLVDGLSHEMLHPISHLVHNFCIYEDVFEASINTLGNCYSSIWLDVEPLEVRIVFYEGVVEIEWDIPERLKQWVEVEDQPELEIGDPNLVKKAQEYFASTMRSFVKKEVEILDLCREETFNMLEDIE